MIRVLVVEDEPPIAKSIKSLAESCDERVKVVYTAINGKRALEYLEGNHVDIVFSDIKMPIMGGLDLARHIQERYPQIVVIIISGFQEFEFAQKAIRYNVNNYLLKPVSKAHIAEVLKPAIAEVLEKREQHMRSLLENAVMNEITQDTFHMEGDCGVFLMYGGAYQIIPDDDGMLGIQDIWNVDAIEDALKSYFDNRESGFCARGRNPAELAVIFFTSDQARIREIAEKLFSGLTKNGKIAITLAVWEELSKPGNIGNILSRLRKRIYKEIKLFSSRLIIDGTGKNEMVWNSDAQQAELLLALKTKQSEAIHLAVETLVDSAVFQSARQPDLELCMEKILLEYFGGLFDMNQLSEIKFEVQSAISTSLRPTELVEEISKILYSWVTYNASQKHDDTQNLCEEMAQYLRQRYKENIRGADLARHFGYSSTQLAKIFKNYYGVSVSEFVNNFRIELAKTIMQTNKKAMIKEVSMDVGYNDQYYFSKLFKKITGMWPTEYQRKLGKGTF